MDKQVEIDPDKCAGCYICQLVCSLTYHGMFNLAKARIKIDLSSNKIEWTEDCIEGCTLCVKYCPYGAIRVP